MVHTNIVRVDFCKEFKRKGAMVVKDMRKVGDFESDMILLEHDITKKVKEFFDKWKLDDITVGIATESGGFVMTEDGKGHAGPRLVCEVLVNNKVSDDLDGYSDDEE